MRSVSVGRRPAITSSSSSSFGSVASARATSSRLRSGSVSAAGQLPALVEQIETPEHLMGAAHRRRGSGWRSSAPTTTLSSTRERRERPHDLEGAADAAPAHLVGRQAVDARALKRDVPASGANTPAIRLNSVVLPAPLGPITAKIAPSGTAKLTSATARNPLKFFETSATSSSAPCQAPGLSRPSRRNSRASGGQTPFGSTITTRRDRRHRTRA